MSQALDIKRLAIAIFREDTPEGGLPSIEDIESCLKSLSHGEQYAVHCYFGQTKTTLKDCASNYPRGDGGIGVTRERFRQILAKALRKLRHPSRLGRYIPKAYWDELDELKLPIHVSNGLRLSNIRTIAQLRRILASVPKVNYHNVSALNIRHFGLGSYLKATTALEQYDSENTPRS